jgi:hypothetical protein
LESHPELSRDFPNSLQGTLGTLNSSSNYGTA